MIYLYSKIRDNMNKSHIFEQPQQSVWAVIVNKNVINKLPTKEVAVTYRNTYFTTQALNWLLEIYKEYITNAPELFIFLFNNLILNKDAYMAQSKVLIYFDLFIDNDESEWEATLEAFKQKFPKTYASRVFKYSQIVNNLNKQKEIKTFLESDALQDEPDAESE